MKDQDYNRSTAQVSQAMREYNQAMIDYITDNVPNSRFKEEAIMNYRQALMWANYALYN